MTLAPGASHTVDLGVLFAQGTSNLQSVTALRQTSDAVQTSYNDGTLFSGQFPTGTAAAPALVAPAEGASFYEAEVTFSWTAVQDADHYVLEVSPTSDFSEIDLAVVEGTSVTFPAARFLPNREGPFSWRVRTSQDGLEGPPSPARTVRVYRYQGAPLTLASGAVASVEVSGPGGAPACDGPSDPDEGCTEVGGDLIVESLNSTGDFLGVYPSVAGAEAAGAFGPNEFEIRFTPAGSIAYSTSGARLLRVPFEVWDVGVVTPGAANDPSDDVQLVAQVGSGPTGQSTLPCVFAYVHPTVRGTGLTTRLVRAYYATTSYADFASVAGPIVASDPTGCPGGASITQPARARMNVSRGAPITGFVMEQAGTRTTEDLAGTTIRFYTVDRLVGAEDGPAPGPLALGAPFPNPAGGRVTLPYTVAAAGPVRLRVVDVLGRTVAVVADG
ncbi:MAG TPA: hypothetical protein VF576_12660, partial [Rubricoccaceae bacterium]